MITAEDVKKHAKSLGADLVGISPMSRFEDACGCIRACMVRLKERKNLQISL